MQGWHKVTGLILKKSRTRDNDQLLVVFTREMGKIMVGARGAQKITSRRLAALDTLNYVHLVLTENRGYFSLKEVSVVSSLQTLKGDYRKKKRLLLAVEIIDKLTSLNQEDRPLFNFLKKFLVEVNGVELTDDELFDKTLALLAILGYSLPPRSIRSWATLEKYLETVSEKSLLSREL